MLKSCIVYFPRNCTHVPHHTHLNRDQFWHFSKVYAFLHKSETIQTIGKPVRQLPASWSESLGQVSNNTLMLNPAWQCEIWWNMFKEPAYQPNYRNHANMPSHILVETVLSEGWWRAGERLREHLIKWSVRKARVWHHHTSPNPPGRPETEFNIWVWN